MTYREDLQAARLRRDALARELREVRSRMDEMNALTQTAAALERELAQCARDLDQARAKVELPLLQRVRVASPCKERWDDMTGDEHVRFCGRCEKNVYDLSSLTASQAEALLRERGESMCVRFFRRSDGTILTSDCPMGTRRKSIWRRTATTVVASGLAAAGIAMSFSSGMLAQGGMERVSPSEPWLERRIDGQYLGGEPSVMGEHPSAHEKIGALNERLEDVQARLRMATTTEDMQAIGSELESLRAEITSLPRREHPRDGEAGPVDGR